MRMDAARNEIILINLKMTLASLCLMVCVVRMASLCLMVCVVRMASLCLMVSAW